MESEDPLIYILLVILFVLVFIPTQTHAAGVTSPPETIVVRVTGMRDCRGVKNVTYKNQVVDFKEYVKSVLPNEWGPDWDEDSLKAGAVAVKMYAWSLYWSQGYVWDCNWNQVYDPGIRREATDNAVDETWNWVFWNNGPVRTYYDDYPAACQSRGHECLSQWRSKAMAEDGLDWKTILNKYYDGFLFPITGGRKMKTDISKRQYILSKFEFSR